MSESGRRLVWARQPSRVRVGGIITPPPKVELWLGNELDPRVINGEVEVRIASGPPGAALQGPTRVSCPSGIAEFPGLRPSLPGNYVLVAECDESSLELIPRPSAYRYYGSFAAGVGQPVAIEGDGSTTGVVSEVGDGFIVVTDASAVFQQTVVAGATSVTVGGAAATAWFAADAPGLDVTDSQAVWHVEGLVAPEASGRYDPLAVNPVPANTPRNIHAPTGPDRGIAATPETGSTAHSYLQGSSVPSIVGQDITALFLASYPLEGRGPINGGMLAEVMADGAPGSFGLSGSTSQSGVACRVGNQWAFNVPDTIRHGRNRWHLVGISRKTRSSSFHPIDIYVDGQLIVSGQYNYNGNPGLLSGIRHVITHTAAFCQAGIWQGIKDEDWHLEQARRCGVAP